MEGGAYFVGVAIAAPLPRVFTYQWIDEILPVKGQRVIVPWGRQYRIGLVYEVFDKDTPLELDASQIRSVHSVLGGGHLLTQHWWHLIEFAAAYYHYPVGMVALEALPKALRVLNARGEEPVMAVKALRQIEKLGMQGNAGKEEGAISAIGHVSPKEFELRPTLNPQQIAAVQHIDSHGKFQVTLLHGITGSGKTEVYLNVIEKALARGVQVLVLLPEINLTPAALALYEARLRPQRVVVLHSNLAEALRTRNWCEAAAGVAKVVIGTRLGVLTPLPNLGLIVVDEEHDPSYKQQDGMRYNARDLAVALGKQRDVPVVLGSATPSIESWMKVQLGHYQLVSLTQRAVAGAGLATVELINTANFPTVEGFSEPVLKALRTNFEAGLQSIVFLNRRGFSPQMACEGCGWVAGCTHCSAHLVWHKRDRQLRCHHCGASTRVPAQCPSCGNQDLTGFGRGTQRVEEVLQGLLPGARVLRIDADSTRNKGEMQELLAQVHSGEADVLVGTQMIAKGHDFAKVGLVVAINADSSLFSQSYRAPERLFAQLMQVAGRAGRRQAGGRMLVQTRYPQHPVFEALKAHNYEQFAQFEIQTRRDARMPPFSYQATLRADSNHLSSCLEFLRLAKEGAQSMLGVDAEVYLCDAVPLTVVKVGGVERAQMLVESESRSALHRFLDQWLDWLYQQPQKVRWFVEVDPSDL